MRGAMHAPALCSPSRCSPTLCTQHKHSKAFSGWLSHARTRCSPCGIRCLSAQQSDSKPTSSPKPKPVNPLAYTEPSEKEIRLRSEAEAPFRVIRLVFYGFFVISASIASLIATTQTIGALAGAPNAMPLQDTATSLAIDLAAAALFAYLFSRDKAAQDKQIARIAREEKLGALQVELSNKRMLRMQQLRSFVRPVIVAGTAAQVQAAVEAAAPFKEELSERGVLVIPVPCFEAEGAQVQLPPLTDDDLRWRANPLRISAWRAWFEEQAQLAGKSPEDGLYVGLRMDGRVRASGRGCPPWGVFARQLPKTDGFFSGFLDSFDGRQTGFD